MKFEELKKTLKSTKFNNFILTGDDEFLLDRAYKIILDAYNIEFKELNLVKFSNENLDFDQVVKALQTLPAFSEYKLVFLDLSTKVSKIANLKILDEYLNDCNKQSILVVKVGQNESQFAIENKSKFTVVDCGRLDKSLAKRFLENELTKLGKSFKGDAFDVLYNYTNGDLSNAMNEVIKLCNFVGERKEIGSEDIESITIKNLEFQIFEITEKLGKKDAKGVYEILEELKSRKDGLKGILPLIYNHFRRLMHISLNQGSSRAQLANMLGIKEYAVGRIEQQLKYFSKRKLKSVCDTCSDLDYKTKNSMISGDLAVEMLVLKILS